MPETELKVGDVVCLKSDSTLRMTVDDVGNYRSIVVRYVAGGELKTEMIHREALCKAPFGGDPLLAAAERLSPGFATNLAEAFQKSGRTMLVGK